VDDQRGIAFLTERIDAIERERDVLLEKSQRLELLQRSFNEIVAAEDEPTLAAATMRGAWLGLGFTRSLWFRIEAAGELAALYELDGDGVGESEYGGTIPPASSLRRIVEGGSAIVTGSAGDLDTALFDTRRRYAAAAVRPSRGAAFVLYADGLSERASTAWNVASLQELATHATVALDRSRMASELERLAMHDPLTNLINRRALMDRLRAELATFKRTGDSLAFAMIDIDDFKSINDARGHAGGDDALRAFASILRSRTRETDIPARFAGDEFALIMPRTDSATVKSVMTRIYDALAGRRLGASIGIAFATRDMSDEALIARADEGVYAAKRAGKNTYRVME
jgi:diguanylate cyclase (GGDEF)-like protein